MRWRLSLVTDMRICRLGPPTGHRVNNGQAMNNPEIEVMLSVSE